MRRTLLWSALGIVVLAGLTAGGVAWWQGSRPPEEAGVAVRVNGDPIFTRTLEAQFQSLLAAYQAIYAPEGRDLEAYFATPQGAYTRLQIRYQAAQQLVDQVLIRQQVARRRLRLDEAQLETAFQQRWREFLDARSVSEEDLKALFSDPQQKRLTQSLLGLHEDSVEALKDRVRAETKAELLRVALARAVLGEAAEDEAAFRRWLDEVKAQSELVFLDPYLRAYDLERQVDRAASLEAKQRALDRAIAAYEELLETQQDPNLEFFLAQLYNFRVNLDLARQRELAEEGQTSSQEAQALEERIRRNREKAASTFLSLGGDDARQLELMLMADPDNPLYNYLYARYLLTQPEPLSQRALRFLLKAIELDPGYADAHALLGDYNVRREHYLQAVDNYRRALELLTHPSAPGPAPRSEESRPAQVRQKLAEALLGLARQQQDEGEPLELVAEARELLEALASELDERAPALPAVLADLGDAAVLEARFEEAQRFYERSLALREDPEVRVRLGDAQLEGGKVEEAFQTYSAVVAAHPAWAEAHLGLARYYRSQGQRDEAVAAYKRAFRYGEPLDYPQRRAIALEALELAPEDPEWRRLLGEFYLERHVYAGAEEQFEKLLELDPASAAAYEGLGRVALERLAYAQAQAWFERGLSAVTAPEARVGLLEGLLETEKRRAGPGRPLGPTGQQTLLELAETYARLGRLGDARAALNQLRERYPDFRPEAVADLAQRLRRGSGDDLPGEAVPDQGHELIAPGQAHPPYNSVPPTSGPHYALPAPWGVHTAPIPDEVELRNLAGGGVILHYRPDLAQEQVEALRALVEELRSRPAFCRLILAPYPGLERPIVLTAWGRLDRLEGFDRARIVRFIETFIDRGPERALPCG